jgi:hypothetical protein
MRIKYNKKRNTAFIYESLISEIFKSIANEDAEKKEKVIEIIKEFFSKDSILFKEMQIYTTIYETRGVSKDIAERLINEAKKDYLSLDADKIFETQTSLINKINKVVSPQVFSNFVPNYRDLATISQIFGGELPLKQRVMLESQAIGNMVKKVNVQKESENLVMEQDDVLTKFNEKYESTLNEDQKSLLSKYVVSFADNGVEFKTHLNKEIGRLKNSVNKISNLSEIKNNNNLSSKVEKVNNILEGFSKTPFNKEVLTKVIKIQSFVKEFSDDGN